MAKRPEATCASHRRLMWKLMTSTAIICVAAACTPLGKKRTAKNLVPAPNFSQKPPKQALKPTNPLHIATTYWATEYQKDPGNPKAALAYAKNLKAIGAKDRAITILGQAHKQHPSDTEIASTYGRLVLEKGQTRRALEVLKRAEKPRGKTDWRVLSARGTAHAKLGEHALAQQYFAAALKKNPGAPSLLNNLALSYAMSGNAEKAEPLLRHAIKNGHDTKRVRQNLALVLGLQKKFTEARQVASVDLSEDRATANMAYLQSMVRNRKLAKAAPKQQESRQLAMKAATDAPKKPGPGRKVKKSPAAVTPKLAEASKPKSRQITSQTMPLPWATVSSQTDNARIRTASATPVPVPLPSPKPKSPAPTTQSPAPAASGKQSRKPSVQPRAAEGPKLPVTKPQKATTQVTAWQTRIAKADSGTIGSSPQFPDMD